MKFAKASTILLLVLLSFSIFLIISLYTNLTSDPSDQSMNRWIDILLNWAIFLLAISCIVLLWMEVAHIIADKKSARKSFIFIGALLGVFLISFLFSGSELPQFNGAERFIADGTLTPAISHWVETCLFTAYFLLAIALLGILYSYIYQLFN
jgi:succinate dehydrogenase hydrophobic anchor subunit